MLSFAGWVPTITGHLSFSLIGVSTGLPGCVAANGMCARSVATGAPRRIVGATQKRITSDFPYNGWPVGTLLPTTKAEYLLIAATEPAATPIWRGPDLATNQDAIGALRGCIYVIPHHKERAVRLRAEACIKKLRSLFAEYGDRAPRGSLADIDELCGKAETVLAGARGSGVKTPFAEFVLYRTGELRLDVSLDNLPPMDGGQAAPEFAELLARQMYYFVKDMAHRHYHHRRSSDNLLPLVKAPLSGDTDWRRDSLWALVRAILETRRRHNLQSYKSALGILAYAEAFQALLAKIHRDNTTPTGFAVWTEATLYDFRHTRASLEATIGEREFTETSNATFWSVLVATVLATAALWLTTLQVIPSICQALGQGNTSCLTPPPFVANILRHLVLSPSDGFGILLLLGLLWYGSRIRTFPLTKWLVDGMVSWGQAFGATIARAWRRKLLGYSDQVATLAAALFLLLTGGLLIALVGAAFGVWQ